MSSNSNQFILNQGAILGGIQVMLLAILYLTDTLLGSGWGIMSWLIYLLFLYWSGVQYRNQYMGGFISYGKAFVYGVKLMVLASVIIGFAYLLLFKFIDPGLTEVIKAEAQEAYLSMGFSEKVVEELSQSLDMISNPWFLMFSHVFTGLLYGSFLSLIVAIFVKRQGDPFQEAMKTVE
jgi:hypothetical protein